MWGEKNYAVLAHADSRNLSLPRGKPKQAGLHADTRAQRAREKLHRRRSLVIEKSQGEELEREDMLFARRSLDFIPGTTKSGKSIDRHRGKKGSETGNAEEVEAQDVHAKRPTFDLTGSDHAKLRKGTDSLQKGWRNSTDSNRSRKSIELHLGRKSAEAGHCEDVEVQEGQSKRSSLDFSGSDHVKSRRSVEIVTRGRRGGDEIEAQEVHSKRSSLDFSGSDHGNSRRSIEIGRRGWNDVEHVEAKKNDLAARMRGTIQFVTARTPSFAKKARAEEERKWSSRPQFGDGKLEDVDAAPVDKAMGRHSIEEKDTTEEDEYGVRSLGRNFKLSQPQVENEEILIKRDDRSCEEESQETSHLSTPCATNAEIHGRISEGTGGSVEQVSLSHDVFEKSQDGQKTTNIHSVSRVSESTVDGGPLDVSLDTRHGLNKKEGRERALREKSSDKGTWEGSFDSRSGHNKKEGREHGQKSISTSIRSFISDRVPSLLRASDRQGLETHFLETKPNWGTHGHLPDDQSTVSDSSEVFKKHISGRSGSAKSISFEPDDSSESSVDTRPVMSRKLFSLASRSRDNRSTTTEDLSISGEEGGSGLEVDHEPRSVRSPAQEALTDVGPTKRRGPRMHLSAAVRATANPEMRNALVGVPHFHFSDHGRSDPIHELYAQYRNGFIRELVDIYSILKALQQRLHLICAEHIDMFFSFWDIVRRYLLNIIVMHETLLHPWSEKVCDRLDISASDLISNMRALTDCRVLFLEERSEHAFEFLVARVDAFAQHALGYLDSMEKEVPNLVRCDGGRIPDGLESEMRDFPWHQSDRATLVPIVAKWMEESGEPDLHGKWIAENVTGTRRVRFGWWKSSMDRSHFGIPKRIWEEITKHD